MRKLYCLLLIVVASLISAGMVRAAGVVNGGFELGNLTGWTAECGESAWEGCDGNDFAWLDQGDQFRMFPKEGDYYVFLGNGVTYPATHLRQMITLKKGDRIVGYAGSNFKRCIGVSCTNIVDAWVSIKPGKRVWRAKGAIGKWQLWKWTAPKSGTYTIELTLYDQDGEGVSEAYFDGIKVIRAQQ